MTFIVKEYIKTVTNPAKLHDELRSSSFSAKVDSVNLVSTEPTKVHIYLTSSLTTQEETEAQTIIDNFVNLTTAESLKLYLDNSVFPFVDGLMNRYAAENIALGITQAGMTGPVLGLFTKPYDVHSNNLPIRLKDTFDTGSLYESIAVIDYLLANPGEFSGLSPYVTAQRLTDMKLEIQDFLT